MPNHQERSVPPGLYPVTDPVRPHVTRRLHVVPRDVLPERGARTRIPGVAVMLCQPGRQIGRTIATQAHGWPMRLTGNGLEAAHEVRVAVDELVRLHARPRAVR